jgi:hypothetical protein
LNARTYVDLEVDDNSIESYLYTMRHIYRQEVKKYAVKSFHVVRNVEFTFNHFPLKCLESKGELDCPYHYISPNQSYFMHYKQEHKIPENCNFEDKRSCAIKDTVMWKYYEELNQNMKIALKNIFNLT